MKFCCSLKRENTFWLQIEIMTSVICNQRNPFFCTKPLRFWKSRDHCTSLSYYCVTFSTHVLNIFSCFSSNGWLWDSICWRLLLCVPPLLVSNYGWMVCQEAYCYWKASKLSSTQKKFFLPLSGNTVRWSFLMRWIMFGTHQILTK